jgi:hypothetical protein
MRFDGRHLGALVLQVCRADAVIAVGDDQRRVVALDEQHRREGLVLVLLGQLRRYALVIGRQRR